jgi:hypothetical protein
MITLHFGSDFDTDYLHADENEGHLYAGPEKLLSWLEKQVGRTGFPEDEDHLRLEWYRQAINRSLEAEGRSCFFADSYQADRYATAMTLLEWRDELIGAGLNFSTHSDLPARLSDLAKVESAFQSIQHQSTDPYIGWGNVDRFNKIIQDFTRYAWPVSQIVLYEPEEFIDPVISRVVSCFRKAGVPVETGADEPAAPAHTALGYLQRALIGRNNSLVRPQPDHSVVVLNSASDSEAATDIALLLKHNPKFKPVILSREMDLTLDLSIAREGIPSLGVSSVTSARPSLQVLKLATAFLWEPLDIYKVMEFVSLPVKPLDSELSVVIARIITQKPGTKSEAWYASILGFLENNNQKEALTKQFQFWFERKRFRMDSPLPKTEAVAIYSYIHRWALKYYEDTGGKTASLLLLAEQAQRIYTLLRALPEIDVSFLELERVVRTIYAPPPIQLQEAEANAPPLLQKQGAFIKQASQTLWWNCVYQPLLDHGERWSKSEVLWLEANQVYVRTAREKRRQNLLLQLRPVMKTTEQLVLIVPEKIKGEEAIPHAVLGDIEAIWGKDPTIFVEAANTGNRFLHPPLALITPNPAQNIPPLLTIPPVSLDEPMATESPTSLESLFYYPHKWYFRQKMRLVPLRLYQVSADNTLKGNLAHRFLDLLLQSNVAELKRQDVYAFVQETAPSLLEKEGATFLLYGREPERKAFLNQVAHAAWTLISILQSNRWKVEATEKKLAGNFMNLDLVGIADLILSRGEEQAIVDFKWSGFDYRSAQIKNEEDLQLVLYAHLLNPQRPWPHTAYFILETGRLIARNRYAFAQAIIPGKSDAPHAEACQRTFEKMERTLTWRLQQLSDGLLEIRTKTTAEWLQNHYADHLLDLLEFSLEDPKWDDYNNLIHFR